VRRTGTNGIVTYSLYDGDDLLLEATASGLRIRQYTHSPGVDQPLSLHTGGATFYYGNESPGHVSGLVNAANQVVSLYRYNPWGEPEAITETVMTQPLRYMAREWDEDLGMYQVRARWYDPQLGRFVSEDPIGLGGGINTYAYVGNSPVNATDPSGLCYKGGWGWTVDPRGTVVSSGACDARDSDISLEALSDLLDLLRGGLGGRIPRGPGGTRPEQPNTCPALLRHRDVLAAGNAAWQRSLGNGREEGAWLLPTSFGVYLERPVPTGGYNTLQMGYAPSRSSAGLPVALHTHPGGVAAQPAHLRAINWRHALSTSDTIFARQVNATVVAVSSDSLSMYTPGDSVRTCAR
jgi:RHS repeat-associated protein